MPDGTTRFALGPKTTAGQGTAEGLFCLNCHSLQGFVHSLHGSYELACTGCHLLNPHGGKLRKLIRTVDTPAPYADAGTPAILRAFGGPGAGNAGAISTTCSYGCGNHALLPNKTTAPVNAW